MQSVSSRREKTRQAMVPVTRESGVRFYLPLPTLELINGRAAWYIKAITSLLNLGKIVHFAPVIFFLLCAVPEKLIKQTVQKVKSELRVEQHTSGQR